MSRSQPPMLSLAAPSRTSFAARVWAFPPSIFAIGCSIKASKVRCHPESFTFIALSQSIFVIIFIVSAFQFLLLSISLFINAIIFIALPFGFYCYLFLFLLLFSSHLP
jgi:hypothetical protein